MTIPPSQIFAEQMNKKHMFLYAHDVLLTNDMLVQGKFLFLPQSHDTFFGCTRKKHKLFEKKLDILTSTCSSESISLYCWEFSHDFFACIKFPILWNFSLPKVLLPRKISPTEHRSTLTGLCVIFPQSYVYERRIYPLQQKLSPNGYLESTQMSDLNFHPSQI